jgi:hypothetical protein
MRYPTAAPRLRAWKLAAAVGALATASLAMAGVADAQVFVAYPQPTGTQLSFAQAVADANATTGNNTIVLQGKSEVGNNLAKFQPTAGLTITGNLTITGAHNAQDITGQGDANIDGTNQLNQSPAADFLTIAAGAHVTIEGVEITNAGESGLAAVRDNGTLTLYGDSLAGEQGIPLAVGNGGTATLVDSSIDGTLHTAGITNSSTGTVTLDNSSITNGAADGIDENPGGTLFLYNSLLVFQAGFECNGGSAQPGTTGTAADGSLDDDGTCNVQFSGDTNADSPIVASADNGGHRAAGQPGRVPGRRPAVLPQPGQRRGDALRRRLDDRVGDAGGSRRWPDVRHSVDWHHHWRRCGGDRAGQPKREWVRARGRRPGRHRQWRRCDQRCRQQQQQPR